MDHPDVFAVDLPRLESALGSPERFEECMECLDQAIRDIQKDPLHEGSPLIRAPLEMYRKKKFHSVHRPTPGLKADMRVVYHYDSRTDILYILGLGQRQRLQQSDIYEIVKARNPI